MKYYGKLEGTAGKTAANKQWTAGIPRNRRRI